MLRRYIDLLRWTIGRIVIREDKRIQKICHPDYNNTFHGYYDVTCFNPKDSNLILIHVTNAEVSGIPNPRIPMFVVVWDWQKNIEIFKSEAIYSWNWQQGARATWYDERIILYNAWDATAKRYFCFKVNIYDHSCRVLDFPVQTISKNFYVSLDYGWMAKIRRDYGYFNKVVSRPAYGLLLCDYNGHVLEELSLDDILARVRLNNPYDIDKLKLNHVLISPSGNAILFLIRYYVNGRRKTDLGLYVLNERWEIILQDCNLSHYCFINDTSVLASITYKGVFGWAILNLRGEIIEFRKHVDGHPYKLSENLFLCDTSPSKLKIRNLYLLDHKLRTRKKIVKSSEYWRLSGETRVDMHPTASANGELFQIDMVHNKRRHIGIIRR